MAGGNLSFAEWVRLPERERAEEYKHLSEEEQFRVRISAQGGAKGVPCNRCRHYKGFARCAAFPDGIPSEHIAAVEENPQIACSNGIRCELI